MSEASVSVIIPCYDQAHFLGEAVESVLEQSRPVEEIIVVDDGSTDDSVVEVLERYPSADLIRQENAGLSAARNTGLRHSKGSHLVFLDADDFLLPHAIEAGLACFNDHPEAAFVFGKYVYVDAGGKVDSYPSPPPFVGNPFEMFLQQNAVGMHGAVMYRRDAVQDAGGFDPSLPAAEDYDLYLRLSRIHPVTSHDRIVAAYRRHGNNMSGRPLFMLWHTSRVLRSQRSYAEGNSQRMQAYRTGQRYWKRWYGRKWYYKYCPGKIRGLIALVQKLFFKVKQRMPERIIN